jgi:hypothetical protein
MALQLDSVFPWGRRAREYRAMFALSPQDLNGRVLDCGGGPSSFTAEMSQQGKRVLSCDPLYGYSAEEIRQRIAETYPRITALTTADQDKFLWNEYGSPEQLGQIRLEAMNLFLDDYEAGRAMGRYVVGELPALPFASERFDLALCSHFLFTYSESFSQDFHLASLLEMARVAREVRVFPLLTAFSGIVSPHLPHVMEELAQRGHRVETRTVGYEFQKGGNQMLCVKRTA